ncbi:MAG: hypothetical protein RMJ56_11600 [Gemmataceae bacterium]|nr:hypothetical protein [Gemmata sp.]MDW8198236.1 hypothetical protein [Gemmataceae bacterium]
MAGRRGPNADKPQLTVRCPNPECRMKYFVPAEYAGKRARCAACGTRTQIPNVPPAAAPTPPPALAAKAEKAPRTSKSRQPDFYQMQIGCIGRGHAGKSALFHALSESLVGNYLPSGLHLDAADPREVARMIREAEAAQKLLQKSGLPPTLEVSHTRYCLSEGDKRKAVCRMQEVIGQVLTHTMPDSEPQLQERYTEYLRSLVNADVLWAVVPCPPAAPSPRDRRRYANDLRIVAAYLREALRLRTLERPAGIALVLSKTDALFASAHEAREALTENVLMRALGPLVNLIQQSDHVADAIVIPVSAFGFGKAVLHPQAHERHGAPGSAEEPFGDEPIWLLKEGETPDPFNVDALFLWSLLTGFLSQLEAAPVPDGVLDTLCRMLRDDLETTQPWLVPIKGGVKLAT